MLTFLSVVWCVWATSPGETKSYS